jgi:hypothetical protein
MQIHRRVTTRAPQSAVFAFMADFTTTNEWDPGTVQTTRAEGGGGVGTVYDNVSKFLGRETRLRYVVQEYEPESRVALRGENSTTVAHDTITVLPTPDGGTQVDYQAEFSFKGVTRLLAPLFAPAFRRLGDDAERGLQDSLDRLAS